VKLETADPGRYAVTCNGRTVPLQQTETSGVSVAGVRFKAWQPAMALHPVLPVNAPLTFDIYDTWTGRALGGCVYRRTSGRPQLRDLSGQRQRGGGAPTGAFVPSGHTAGRYEAWPETPAREFPMTLDMRRPAGL
jgi:uncharacterized protein (DUF2126 family)